MSEPKLCPFFVLYAQLKDTDVLKDAKTLSFYGCLEDKCAMWRNHAVCRDDAGRSVLERIEGYCGLAGKPY